MLKKIVTLVCFTVGSLSVLHGQATPTASKSADLQVGGTFVLTKPDYGTQYFKGYGFYSTFDFRPHLGVEVDYRQANGENTMYERNYMAGLRYVRQYGRFRPYAKVLYGRGVFNFPPQYNGTNLAYNMFAFGGGTDYILRRSVYLRADFELQKWGGDNYGLLPNGISPYVFSFGAAYHFH